MHLPPEIWLTPLRALLVLLYCLPVFCLGARLLGLILPASARREAPPPVALAATAMLLGSGSLAFLWLFLGLAGWFNPYLAAAVLAACLVAGGGGAFRLLGAALGRIRAGLSDAWALSLPWRLLLLLSGGLALVLAAAAFIGPVVLGSDASSFYMVLPKMMAHAGRLVATTDVVAKHSSFGFLGEMHFAALMALGAGSVAKGFAFIIGMVLALVLLSLASRAGLGRGGQLLALILLLTTGAYSDYLYDGKVDLFCAAFGLAAVYWALQVGRLPDRPVMLLIGLLLGWGVYAKLSLLVSLVPPITLLILWRGYLAAGQPGPTRGFLADQSRNLLLVAAVSVAVLLVLVIKNGLLLGEPFAPVYYSYKSWGTWFASRGYTEADKLKIVLTYPLLLVWGKHGSQGGTLSPLIWMFLPLALALPRRGGWQKSPLCQVSLAALAGLVVWIIIFPSGIGVRFLLPILLLFILLAARGAEYVLRNGPRALWLRAAMCLAVALISLQALSNVSFLHSFAVDAVHFAVELRKPNAYTQKEKAHHRNPVKIAEELVSRKAAPGDRVYLALTYRYWLRPDLLVSLFDKPEWLHFHHLPHPEARWTYLYQQGVRFVILDRLTHNYMFAMLGIKNGEVPRGVMSGTPPWLEAKRIFHEYRWSVFQLVKHEKAGVRPTGAYPAKAAPPRLGEAGINHDRPKNHFYAHSQDRRRDLYQRDHRPQHLREPVAVRPQGNPRVPGLCGHAPGSKGRAGLRGRPRILRGA